MNEQEILNRLEEISSGYSDYIASIQEKEKNKKRGVNVRGFKKIPYLCDGIFDN